MPLLSEAKHDIVVCSYEGYSANHAARHAFSRGSVAATSLNVERVYLLKTDTLRPLSGDTGPIYTKRSAFRRCGHREGADGPGIGGTPAGARSASSGVTSDR